jgi:DNA-binding NarL/FixJ family response regulator
MMSEYGNVAPKAVQIVRILHVDSVLAAGLHALLEYPELWQVVRGDATRLDANLVVTDHATGLALARARHAVPVLIVSSLEREWEVREALNSGVRGYLPQSCTSEELKCAVQQMLEGREYLSSALRDRFIASMARASLTARETDVLQLLAEGSCNKIIARELGIGLGTVKTHVKSVMAKLGATARTHAVVLAAQRGLVSPGQQVVKPNPMTLHTWDAMV